MMEIITTENIMSWVENSYNQDLEEDSKENQDIMQSKFVSVESLLERLELADHRLCGVNCDTCDLIEELKNKVAR